MKEVALMGIDGNGHYRKFGKTNPWQTREAVADVLMQKFEKFFNTKRVAVGDQIFTVDLMSEDESVAVKIVTSSGFTSYGEISSAKFQKIISACVVLQSIPAKRKILIFTNQYMFEKFHVSIKKMPWSIQGVVQTIELCCIPLQDDPAPSGETYSIIYNLNAKTTDTKDSRNTDAKQRGLSQGAPSDIAMDKKQIEALKKLRMYLGDEDLEESLESTVDAFFSSVSKYYDPDTLEKMK
jgi:hypothetical protein